MRVGVRPHVEKLSTCADCKHPYCSQCKERCPECLSIHIKPGRKIRDG